MARIPWLLYVRFAAQGIPLVAAWARRLSLTAPRRWIAGWCIFLIGFDSLSLLLALANRNNHWMTYVVTPLEGAILLSAFSLWQITAFGRRALRAAIPLLWIIWIVLVLLVEDMRTFSLLAEPTAGLVVMGTAIWTLVIRTSRESGRLRDQDWLWIGIGVAMYAGSAVALPPASYLLLPKSPELVVRAYEVRGVFNIVAFALIARGFLSPLPRSLRGTFK